MLGGRGEIDEHTELIMRNQLKGGRGSLEEHPAGQTDKKDTLFFFVLQVVIALQ